MGTYRHQPLSFGASSKPAELYYDKPRPDTLSGEACEENIVIDGDLYSGLQELCGALKTSSFAVLLGAFRAAHFRLTGAEDAAIGAPATNQSQGQGAQSIRTTVQDDDTLESLIQQIQSATATTSKQDDATSKERNGNQDPTLPHKLFFAVHPRWVGDGKVQGKDVAFDVEVHLYQRESSFCGKVLFASELFYPKTIKCTVSIFYEMLKQALVACRDPIASLSLSGCPWPAQVSGPSLIKWTDYPRESSIVDVFRNQVASCPDTIAVKETVTGLQLTYRELDQQSDYVFRWLANQGLKAETLVGIYAARSCQALVAMLGVLKAGLAYLPLDINSPASRIETILSSIPSPRLVIHGDNTSQLQIQIADVEIFRLAEVLNSCPSVGLEVKGPSATSLAYVMFTSGSTGQPKGVMIEHRGVVRLARQSHIISGFYTGIGIAHVANLAFDASTWEIYAALLNGGTLVCFDYLTVLNIPELSRRFVQEDIRVAKFTPALLEHCLTESATMFGSLEKLFSAGDRLYPHVLQQALDCTQGCVFNAYGPTENTGFSTCFEASRNKPLARVPIGHSISDSGALVMDSQQRLVPPGIIGELVVIGDGLARGYLNPKQNQDRFIKISHNGQVYRAYRTGDYARYHPKDGVIEYFGRMDNQIKIRGHRIELGETEQMLLNTGIVKDAVAVAQIRGSEANPKLVAFVTMRQKKTPKLLKTESELTGPQDEAVQLRRYLQARLPEYMVPQTVCIIDEMPLNQNKKVDRRALAAMEISAVNPEQNSRVAPRNDTERALCEEFAAVLGLKVGIMDSFFDLGGHSLTATRLISRINKRLATNITIKYVLDYPRVAELSQKIRPLVGLTPYVPIAKCQYDGPVEQSFAQGRLWFLDQLYPDSLRYLITYRWRLQGSLHLPALHAAVCALENRHEPLRTTFEQQNGVEVQIVQPFKSKELRVVQVDRSDIKRLSSLLDNEQLRPFNLQCEPGWRVAVFQLGPHEHVLTLVMHHIISDGWSVDVLQNELGVFYSAAVKNEDPLSQVPPLPIQYRDFAIWQRQDEQTAQQQRQLAYWAQKLKGSQPAELHCDYPRPTMLSGQAGEEEVIISGQIYQNLQRFCSKQQVTPFTALLSAFRATHYRLTGAEDATIGCPIANRNRQELETLIGFFVNLQCIRSTVQGESFENLVQQIHSAAAAAFENQDVPFEKIVTELKHAKRDTSRNPLVQLTFAVHDQQNFGRLSLQDLQVDPIPYTKRTRFDLEFHLYQRESSFQGSILYAQDLFVPETIKAMVSTFYDVLRECLNTPCIPIASLPFTNVDILDLLQTKRTDYPRESSVVDVFRRQVAVHPNVLAVKDNSSQLTYAELDQQSERVYWWLTHCQMQTETPVGVFMPRCCQTIVAFLGILKANLAYLPLDVNAPSDRIKTIISSVPGLKLVLHGRA